MADDATDPIAEQAREFLAWADREIHGGVFLPGVLQELKHRIARLLYALADRPVRSLGNGGDTAARLWAFFSAVDPRQQPVAHRRFIQSFRDGEPTDATLGHLWRANFLSHRRPSTVDAQSWETAVKDAFAGSTAVAELLQAIRRIAARRDESGAGATFMRVIKDDPAAQAALHRAQARMRAFAEALKDSEFQREHERARREQEQAFSTLGEAIQAAARAAQQDLAGLGFMPPKTLEDWEHLARVVEMPFETIQTGNFTARDVYVMALAWIERQQMRERVTQPPSRGATSLEDGHRAASVKLSAPEGLVLRILHDLECGELRNRLPHIILGPAAPPCTSFVWAIASAIDPRCPTEAAIPALEKMGLIRGLSHGTIQGGEWHLPNGRVTQIVFDYESVPKERRGTDRRRIGVLSDEGVFSADGQPNVYITIDDERKGGPDNLVPGLARFYTCTSEGIQAARTLPPLSALADAVSTLTPIAPVDPAPTISSSAQREYDLFICHASEDKPEVVMPLTDELIKRGLRVWVDYQELRLGDKLRERIEEGLRRSRFGVVVVSPRFFAKDWPQTELDGLVALEQADGRKRILPIWHDVDQAVVAQRSPTLAGRLATKWKEGARKVVDDILHAVRS